MLDSVCSFSLSIFYFLHLLLVSPFFFFPTTSSQAHLLTYQALKPHIISLLNNHKKLNKKKKLIKP